MPLVSEAVGSLTPLTQPPLREAEAQASDGLPRLQVSRGSLHSGVLSPGPRAGAALCRAGVVAVGMASAQAGPSQGLG